MQAVITERLSANTLIACLCLSVKLQCTRRHQTTQSAYKGASVKSVPQVDELRYCNVRRKRPVGCTEGIYGVWWIYPPPHLIPNCPQLRVKRQYFSKTDLVLDGPDPSLAVLTLTAHPPRCW
ncbi:hypothetical protein GJAV_G00220590 [Gymnothorax javanicus]|nr:hypothetical protein GJAV_G00220590 [Gymnothorax javanicus]